MGSKRSNDGVFDFWSEISVSNEEQRKQSEIAVIYKRREPSRSTNITNEQIRIPNRQNRFSLAAKRNSLNRSLSIRGRTSIVVSAGVDYQPQKIQNQARNRPKRPLPPSKKNVKPPTYEKEKAYFDEVDSFDLIEESPSPKNFGTWATGVQNDQFTLPHFNSRLGKWLISKKLNYSCGPSSSLSNILETPVVPMDDINRDASVTSNDKTPERTARHLSLDLPRVQESVSSSVRDNDSDESHTCPEKSDMEAAYKSDDGFEEINKSIKRLSLKERLSLHTEDRDPFMSLLRVCNQSAPSTLLDLFSKYSDPGSIVKIGEGTFGEAFMAGEAVCKIVPIDGDLLVNGEVQKKSAELLDEVLLSWTLNRLRGQEFEARHSCTTFIETLDVRVCQGSYDDSLIKAWEDWDAKFNSENDHPKEFPNKQCYVVFVLAHGGKDLENFVLLDFDEAQSLLVQVTAALAVAEATYEFEHRDLHWGNILLTRTGAETTNFILEGKPMVARTFGLTVSIIDFTLSRINTGDAIHFLDLSTDLELFEVRKGDKQSETYRKMKEVTEDCWEGSFPKTNVLWLQYLVDILLMKKSFKQTPKDVRNLRSLGRRLSTCPSAKEALADPFFSELLIDHTM